MEITSTRVSFPWNDKTWQGFTGAICKILDDLLWVVEWGFTPAGDNYKVFKLYWAGFPNIGFKKRNVFQCQMFSSYTDAFSNPNPGTTGLPCGVGRNEVVFATYAMFPSPPIRKTPPPAGEGAGAGGAAGDFQLTWSTLGVSFHV